MDGEHFLKACVEIFTHKRTRNPFQRKQFVDRMGQRLYPTFHEGNERDLLLHNTQIKHEGISNTPKIRFNSSLAIKVGWLTKTWELDPKLSPNFIDDKVPDLTSSSKYHELMDKDKRGAFWTTEKNCPSIGGGGAVTPAHTLPVYCNVAQSTMVGGIKTYLLCKVWYERRGSGVVYSKPKHKHPVR